MQIAAKRADGTLRRWLPIWVVCIGEHVYVRTWYRRNTGWWQLQPQPRPFGSTRSAAEPAPYRSPGSPSSESRARHPLLGYLFHCPRTAARPGFGL